ncbi:MAG: AAA family ATPase [Opitutales bacterium]|nr:AAA family ATPase [Opitutales bacterium]
MNDRPLEHFGLKARPFEIVTDPRFFYASRAHEEALARLLYLVDQESMYFGMLTGEIGAGKSITRRVFGERINRRRHYVVEFENSAFSFGELIRRLLAKAGYEPAVIPPADEMAALFQAVADLASALGREQGRQLVLLFDEAQDLGRTELEHLKRLSNLNGEIEGRLTCVLIGQPELRAQVAALPALDQRVSLRFHLGQLGEDEVAPYLGNRLRVAGHVDGKLFDEAAVAALYAASGGVPREINRLAKLALDAAASSAKAPIGKDEVARVINDLREHQSLPSLQPFAR